MSTPLLLVEHLTKDFHIKGFIRRHYLRAVEDVSFQIYGDKPKILSLAGESGSGKTTIGRIILGLIKPSYGKVLYNGEDIEKLIKKNRAEYRRRVQPIFQDPYASFNPFYRAKRILLKTASKFKVPEEEVIKSLEFVRLRPEEVLHKYPHELSGGQLQRILIARALMLKPKIIVADEPVSMVDASLRAGILELILDLKEKENTSIIYITHDLSTAYYMSDEIIILYKGRIVEYGESSNIIEEPLHPYTKLLISSIPIPDPDRKPKEKLSLKVGKISTDERNIKRNYCVFKDRCPNAFKRCLEEKPELVDIGKNRRVACFLYY